MRSIEMITRNQEIAVRLLCPGLFYFSQIVKAQAGSE